MRTLQSYRIVVMSRRRTHNMPQMMSLIPSATVFVEDSEVDEYKKFVPRDQIVGHPVCRSFGHLRNQAIDAFTEDCIVYCDDDFNGASFLVGRHVRKTTDPDDILRLIENGVNVAADLALDGFSWGSSPNPMNFKASDPFGLTGLFTHIFGVRRSAYRFDEALMHGDDTDITLQVLQKGRIALIDRRVFMDFEPGFTGKGGLQGIRSSNDVSYVLNHLKKKWQGNLDITPRPGRVDGSRIKVQRRSSMSSTRDGSIK